MPTSPIRLGAAVFVVAAAAGGLWLLGDGLWMKGKAALAQVLLERSWREARVAGGRPRPWPWADTWPVAKLRWPAQSIDRIVLSQASGRNLAFGPSHVPPSAVPGRFGHVVLSGHRDTHFGFIARLRPGDRIDLEHPKGLDAYRVVATRVLDLRQEQLQLEPEGRRLTLVTCYPFDTLIPGGPLRYLVELEPLG